MFPGSDRTSIGPKRTIGVRFPVALQYLQGTVPTVTGCPAKCAIVGSGLHGARTKRVLVCRTSLECGRFRKTETSEIRRDVPGVLRRFA